MNNLFNNNDWLAFTAVFEQSENIIPELLTDLNNDVTLANIIYQIVGETAHEWIYRPIPALNGIRPVDCLKNDNLLNDLKRALMRMTEWC